MNPYKLREIYKYLTRAKKADPELPNVFPASKAPIPPVRKDVETIDAVNEFMLRNPRVEKAGGGNIGGGNIKGTPIGDRTGFANIFLDQGKKSRFGKNSDTVVINGKEYLKITKKGDPNFGKYVYRTSVATPGYGRGGKGKNEYLNLSELKKRIDNPKTGKAEFKTYSKGYLAELEDIKKFVNNKGAKNIYLSDLIEKFGDVTKSSSDEVRDPTTEKKIKRAIGDDTYKKLIKGGDRAKTILQKKKTANELVRAIKRGDKPLISLSSDMTGEAPNTFKSYLGKTERNMYDSIIPKLKAIVSRVTQPRQIYQATDAIEELKKATTKTFNQIIKKYPQALAARNVLTSGKGIVAYNDRSYILSQLNRHVQNGGTKYKYVSGNTTATIKFRNTETGKMISLNNIDVKDPEFKEAANAYNQKQKIMDTEIDDPRIKGSKIKIGQAIAANGDSIVIDHLDDVKNNPLKNLAITNQKANMAATIKGATEAELKSIGRGVKLNVEDNIKRYSNYAKRVLISPDIKRPGPKETIFTKTGTLRGVTDPPDIEIKRLVATLGGANCGRGFKNQGGRIGLQEGTPNVDACFKNAINRINQGLPNATPAEAKNFTKVLKLGRNILKFGIIPEALFIGAESIVRLGLGDSPTEALLRASEYIIPGNQTDMAEVMKVARTMSPEKAALVERALKYKSELGNIENLEAQKQSAEILSPTSEFDYLPDRTQDIKYIEQRILDQKQNLTKINEAQLKGSERIQDEAYDIAKSRSPITKLKAFAGDIELPKDDPLSIDLQPVVGKIKTTFPSFRDDMETANIPEQTVRAYFEKNPQEGNADNFINYQNILKNQTLNQAEQTYNPEELYGASGLFFGQPVIETQPRVRNTSRDIDPFQAAGGGIAKIAGIDQGPAPTSGPNPQGLLSLKNRVRNY